MTTPTYQTLRQAIVDRKQVTCTYNGLVRHVCPHAIGEGKNGTPMLFSYQFGGMSSKGPLPPPGDWRCMAVSDVKDVTVTSGDWHTGTGHSRPQSCVKRIDVEVPY